VNFTVKQGTFEGPLELLLELIENEELAISEISLARVTDDFLTYVRSLDQGAPPELRDDHADQDAGVDPEILAEFLVTAAHLMLIKSRSLLPDLELSQEEEQSIEELEDRLMQLKKMRDIARQIKDSERAGKRIFTREPYREADPVFYPPPHLAGHTLADAFSAFLASIPKIEILAEEKIRRVVSLHEQITHIRSILLGAVEQTFSQIVKGSRDRIDLIITFLAILELARERFVDVTQEKRFEEITIRRV
jgi:segregation and condensation protein A